MQLKVIVIAAISILAVLQLSTAQNRPTFCSRRNRRGRFRNETRTQARARFLRERCICRPNLAQCQNTRRPPNNGRPSTPAPPPPAPRIANIASLRRSLRSFINRNLAQRLPAAMQLVFHSCVGSTGCDGCINPNIRDNRGLIGFNNDVIDLWISLGRPITIADFVVLLGTVAVELGMEQRGGPGRRTVAFRTGRTGCADPRNYRLNHDFPEGQDPNSVEFLMREFRIGRRLAIALLGAHSLGKCSRENSGFEGDWDNTPLVLDNGYYQSLALTDWRLTTAPNGFTQWTRGNRMMLHADMALIRNLRISSGQNPRCSTSNECPSSGADDNQARRYVRNEGEWATDFVAAFHAMVGH